jgi:hypothetical protein
VAASADPGGALVVLCEGHRCAALHRLSDDGEGAAGVSDAVAATPGAVLVTTPCLGRCSLGALAGIAHRDGDTSRTSAALWLSGMEASERGQRLRRWITEGGPSRDPQSEVPVELRAAVVGVGPPPVVRPA